TRNPTRSPFFVLGLNNATLETAIGISLSTMPPCTGGMAFGLAFWCFLAMLMPSTSTRSSSNTRSTVPRRPLSFPLMTTTSSPFLILFISNFLGPSALQAFRRQRNDLHKLVRAKLARHRPENAGADRLEPGIEEHCCVAVKANQRTILAANALARANHNRVV